MYFKDLESLFHKQKIAEAMLIADTSRYNSTNWQSPPFTKIAVTFEPMEKETMFWLRLRSGNTINTLVFKRCLNFRLVCYCIPLLFEVFYCIPLLFRHAICHGCTDIIYFLGVNFSSEVTVFGRKESFFLYFTVF